MKLPEDAAVMLIFSFNLNVNNLIPWCTLFYALGAQAFYRCLRHCAPDPLPESRGGVLNSMAPRGNGRPCRTDGLWKGKREGRREIGEEKK